MSPFSAAAAAVAAAIIAGAARPAAALDNGFGLPGLYWSSWNHFGGSISDELLRSCADAMVESGLRDAGYSGINLDDGRSRFTQTHQPAPPPTSF